MKIDDIGEFGLIEQIAELVKKEQKKNARVSVGIGDDTAVVAPPDADRMLLTTDTMVENVHFNRAYVRGEDIGYKAMATNISDIAAMGGRPDYATVTLGLPRDTEVEFIKDIYRGLLDCGQEYGATIVGGDLTKANKIFITVSLTGHAGTDYVKLRSYAEPGDVVMVTGALGGAGAALKGLKAGARPGRGMPKSLFLRFARPTPRLAEGLTAAKEGAGAMQDISDGLLADLKHICQASGHGAKIRLNSIPVFPEASRLPGLSKASALRLALTGGEDYELIITANPAQANIIKAKVEVETNTQVSFIGEITEAGGGVEMIDEEGRAVVQRRTGYDHFTGGSIRE
ncbi:MAG: thiamine-phosphate kinase [Actinomycetota bacterium]